MLKTTTDQPGKPNRALMALGILQGYLKHPLWFLLTTMLSLPRFKKQLPSDLPRGFVEFTALQTWMYKRLKARVGQAQAYEIVRACILPIGLALQQGNFRAVVTLGSIKVQAIATPGHTPGSMSYLVDDGVLFSGDTLVLRNGQAYPFYRLVNMDAATQEQSIRKLTRLQNVALLCTAHTGCTTDYQRAMVHWRPQGAGTKHV